MKKSTAILTSALGLALGSLNAQTVPPFINYQGKVTDSAGVGLGTGTPVNRKVIFRVFDAPSAGNRLWSEQHTVTISNGEFSVLLGSGIDTVFNNVTENPTTTNVPLATVFTAAGIARFVEIVVDNGDNILNTQDAAIAPRQQITSTAYSFRARSADSISSGTDLQLHNDSNYGLGYYGESRRFNNTPVDGPVLFGASGGALGSVNGPARNIALRWNAAGNVGIGVVDPKMRLQVAGAIASNAPAGPLDLVPGQVALTGTGVSPISGKTIFGTDGSPWGYSIASKTGAAPEVDHLTVMTSGNVGIGTIRPDNRLTVQGTSIDNNPTNSQHALQVQIQNGIGPEANALGIGVLDNGIAVLQAKRKGVGYNDLLLNPVDGRVGIGMNSPEVRLSVASKLNGWPRTSGTLQPFASLRLRGEDNAILDFGTNSSGGSWLQSTDQTKLDLNYPLLLNPNGGNVGIGTTGPAARLHVVRNSKGMPATSGNIQPAASLRLQGDDDAILDFGTAGGSGSWLQSTNSWGLNTNYPLFLNPNGGAVGINTQDLTHGNLNVAGPLVSIGRRTTGSPGFARLAFTNNGAEIQVLGAEVNTGVWRGALYNGDSDWNFMSDATLKTDVVDAEPMLDRLMQLQFRRFRWKDNDGPGVMPEFGVIAQEVQPLFPEIVEKLENGLLTVGYTTFATIACKSIQELDGKLEKEVTKLETTLEEKLSEKEQEIAALEARLAALEKLVNSSR